MERCTSRRTHLRPDVEEHAHTIALRGAAPIPLVPIVVQVVQVV
jgi:hypothetical protein